MSVVIWAIAVYFLIALALVLWEEKLIFLNGLSRDGDIKEDKTIAFTINRDSDLRTPIELEGFYIKRQSKTALLWFDGNCDNVWVAASILKRVSADYALLNSIDVIALNYRGYGRSGGKPTQKALFEDAIALYDHIRNGYNRIIAIGRSLGSGVVCYMASERKLNGAILITPYNSIRALAKWRFGFFAAHIFIRNAFKSDQYIKNVKTPFALLSVENDRIIPNVYTDRLAKRINVLTLNERLGDATHASIASDPRLFAFIENALKEFCHV
ncbi:MAG: lysophospholipase [Helicobacteraceae bacterium]|jgi:pimeloyl-ACP methyl ester carboxylesterase|nr:lysophospholipase [Helicobacteraceae bacterium]